MPYARRRRRGRRRGATRRVLYVLELTGAITVISNLASSSCCGSYRCCHGSERVAVGRHRISLPLMGLRPEVNRRVSCIVISVSLAQRSHGVPALTCISSGMFHSNQRKFHSNQHKFRTALARRARAHVHLLRDVRRVHVDTPRVQDGGQRGARSAQANLRRCGAL